MRSTKKVFWASLITGIISIGLIILFHSLSSINSNQKDIYTAVENVFISLVGGAFLSSATAFIGFKNIKRKYIVDFSSDYLTIINKIKCLQNIINWHFNDIKYVQFSKSDSKLDHEQKIEQQKVYDIDNDRYVPMIYNSIKDVSAFNLNRMYEILDDYTGLWLFSKNPKARVQMKIMMDEVLKYHIANKQCKVDYALYEQKDYDNYLFYTKVISEYYKTCKEVSIKNLCDEHKIFLKVTKINDYLKSIYNGLIPMQKEGKNK